MEEWKFCKHGIFEKIENLIWTNWNEEEVEETELTEVGKDHMWNQVSILTFYLKGQRSQ